VRVAVLIDGGTVSASEVLVLKALQSRRAVVIGEPTAGALDYQSVYILRLSPEEGRWFLGYPTITRHAGLPAGGMRGKGIQPDVMLRWSEVADEYAEVERILRR
jgi:C-terminal processing protease CtpA/Prc